MRNPNFGREYTIKGAARTSHGSVSIFMNHRSENVMSHNAITHDDYLSNVSYHKIVTYIESKVWKEAEVTTKEALLDKVKDMIEDLKSELTERANTIPAKSFEEKLNDILNS
jgi:hypothetical protein